MNNETFTATTTYSPWQPDRQCWKIEGLGGDWIISDYPNDCIDYSQIIEDEQRAWYEQPTVYYGKVISKTEGKVVFQQITMNDMINILRPLFLGRIKKVEKLNWTTEGF